MYGGAAAHHISNERHHINSIGSDKISSHPNSFGSNDAGNPEKLPTYRGRENNDAITLRNGSKATYRPIRAIQLRALLHCVGCIVSDPNSSTALYLTEASLPATWSTSK